MPYPIKCISYLKRKSVTMGKHGILREGSSDLFTAESKCNRRSLLQKNTVSLSIYVLFCSGYI